MRTILHAILLAALSSAASCDPSSQPLLGSRAAPLVLNDYGFALLASGDNDDWSDNACFFASGICHVVGHASGSAITGLDKSVFMDQDVAVWIKNRGTTTIVVKNDDPGSSVENRIHTRSGRDVLIPPRHDHMFVAVVDWSTSPYTDAGWEDLGFGGVQHVTTSTPSRSLGTAFQPSLDRPVMVTYTGTAECEMTLSGGEEGRVELVSDASNPPSTVRAVLARCKQTGQAVLGLTLIDGDAGSASYVASPGDWVLLRGVTVTGTPVLGLDATAQVEQVW